MKEKSENISSSISFEDFKNQILADYKTIVLSRECSYLGRKERFAAKPMSQSGSSNAGD